MQTDEPIKSIFDSRYYFRAICGAVVVLAVTAYLLYHCILGNLMYPAQAYGITIIFCGLCWVYYHFFSKSWKTITIAPREIVFYNVVFKKKLTIPFDEVTSINTYRSGRGSMRGGIPGQNFVIEYKGDNYIYFNEAWYKNYDHLTMVIYLHKYGPGHGRDRYMARHS